eukprot:SAG11_NODE_1805_length_4229_cov_1.746005_1_plen_190_part_10
MASSSSVSCTSSSSELEGSTNSRRIALGMSLNCTPGAFPASRIRFNDREVAASSSLMPCCVCDDSCPSEVRCEKSGDDTSEIHFSVAGSIVVTVDFEPFPALAPFVNVPAVDEFRLCLRLAFFLWSLPDLWPFFRPFRCLWCRHVPWREGELLLLVLEPLDDDQENELVEDDDADDEELEHEDDEELLRF